MSQALVDHCLELLAPLGAVRAKRMFGGHGLYMDELFIALIAFERLYLKVDATTQPAFVSRRLRAFRLRRQRQAHHHELLDRARRSHGVAGLDAALGAAGHRGGAARQGCQGVGRAAQDTRRGTKGQARCVAHQAVAPRRLHRRPVPQRRLAGVPGATVTRSPRASASRCAGAEHVVVRGRRRASPTALPARGISQAGSVTSRCCISCMDRRFIMGSW